MHSEETLHQRKQDKLQRQVDQHEGKLLSNNHQRLHTSKHVNELIPSKTLTADINIRLQDDSAKDSSVMAFVAVGILIGHLLAILAIIICRCYKARSDTDSDGQKYVDVVSKGHKQEKRNEDVDRSLSNHSLKLRPLSTVRVNRATSTSQRNLLTSQTSLKSTPLTSEKQNQTSRLSLEPPLPVFKSTTGQMSHLSMNSAPPVFRSVPDKRFKLSRMSINSAPPAFGSTKDQTLGLSSNPPVKVFGSKQNQTSFISMKSAPSDLRSAPVKQKQISHLSIKSAPPALDSAQGQLSRLSMKSASTAVRSTQEKQIQTSRLSLIRELSNTRQNKAVESKELVKSNTRIGLLQEKQLPSRLSLRSAPPTSNHANNVKYDVKETSSNPENIFSLTNKGKPRSVTSQHVELKPSFPLTSKFTDLNDSMVSVHEGATSGQRSDGSVHTGLHSIPSVPENNNSTTDDTRALGVRPAPPYLTGIHQFRRDSGW